MAGFGSNAIWFYPENGNWKIGASQEVGSNISGMIGPFANDNWPHDCKSWSYGDGKNWLHDTESSVTIIKYENPPTVLRLTITGEAKKYRGNMYLNGVYAIQQSLTNFYPYCWKQINGSHSIWLSDSHWHIGYTTEMGTRKFLIQAPAFDAWPHEFTEIWRYWNGKETLEAGKDVVLENNNEGRLQKARKPPPW